MPSAKIRAYPKVDEGEYFNELPIINHRPSQAQVLPPILPKSVSRESLHSIRLNIREISN